MLELLGRVGGLERQLAARDAEIVRLKGLVLQTQVVRLRRERWLTPQGQSITTPLPVSVAGHFGLELRRFVLAQCHQGQMTVTTMPALNQGVGIRLTVQEIL